MGWERKILPIFIMLLGFSFAYVIESGDNGAQFAADKASAVCAEGNAEAVYVCLGNVVKAVSSDPSIGSTFYKPDGKTVSCPVVAPTDMGGECLQMMVPNYCPGASVCGDSPEKVFPGQNGTPEQAVIPTYTQPLPTLPDSGSNASAVVSPPIAPPKKNSTAGVFVSHTGSSAVDPVTGSNSDRAPQALPNTFDFALDNLLLIVLGLGIAGVAVLFALFRNSLSEEEEKA